MSATVNGGKKCIRSVVIAFDKDKEGGKKYVPSPFALHIDLL